MSVPPETGPMQFPKQLPGIYIDGYAAHAFANDPEELPVLMALLKRADKAGVPCQLAIRPTQEIRPYASAVRPWLFPEAEDTPKAKVIHDPTQTQPENRRVGGRKARSAQRSDAVSKRSKSSRSRAAG